jgi:hypothetical protein
MVGTPRFGHVFGKFYGTAVFDQAPRLRETAVFEQELP